MTERRLLLLNGPNLNLLGSREPEIYGSTTLAQIEENTRSVAVEFGFDLRALQSNHEGELVDAIQAARADCAGIILNPAAYTHTSVAIRDALAGVELPVVEVHLSNVARREEFRQHSYVSGVADAVIAGAGALGYEFAVRYLADRIGS
ncbi:3-dehydroquinate dehydratase [Mycolicibacterium chitae]|uniref:3-dehydroquinate dehydratase n=1 Tax=Mycolicibacterium chitae TaxID=1792 RepID=A0A448I9M7_MYCCI|nr:type II 3-dehydroquinate dehydratase [Mycolicibacterium chitae]MCV7104657.1 type II 3-dehydroquinate dehydratase [Mycolicibacterium chitae]BBZ05522.1 3-dehydroquinate dehydratase [Mycolicibacterium chitae]VEG49136.1 3-dehydroquinate dehydratase [Mycolicibacterium chitae]